VEGLEDSVSRLDLRQAELGEKLQDPKTYTIPGEVLKINLELKRVAAEIAEKTNLWETEATKLALMEGDNAATT
jgi:hypothetical protein